MDLILRVSPAIISRGILFLISHIMKLTIDMDHDYWADYYELKKLIEAGKSRDFRKLDNIYCMAKAKSEAVRRNYEAIGIS